MKETVNPVSAETPETPADEPTLIIATALGDITSDSIVKVVATEKSVGDAKKKIKDASFLQSVATEHFGNEGYALYVVPQKSQKKVQCVTTFGVVG